MPGFNPENINIHDLTVEESEQKREMYFDPEKEITESDWKQIQDKLAEMQRKKYMWDRFPEFGAALKLLKPDIDLHVTAAMWKAMEGKLREYSKSDHSKGEIFTTYAANIKIISPDFRVTKSDWENMQKALAMEKLDKNWVHTAYVARSMKILDPKVALDLGQELGEEISKTMRGHTTVPLFLDMGWSAKILDPNFNLALTPQDSEQLKELLQERRDHGDWEHFASVAAQAKVLAAEKVKVTDKGLEIIMKEPDFQGKEGELPEQRKF